MGKLIYIINRIPLSMNNKIIRQPDEIYRIFDNDMVTLHGSNLFIAQYILDRFDDLQIGDNIGCLSVLGEYDASSENIDWNLDITPKLFSQLTNKKEIVRKIKEKFHFIDYKDAEYDPTNIVSKTLIEELCRSKNPDETIVNIELLRNGKDISHMTNIPLQDIKNDIVYYIGEKFLKLSCCKTTCIREQDVVKYNIYNQSNDSENVHLVGKCVVTKDHMKKFYNDKENNVMDIMYKIVRENNDNQEDTIFETIDTSMKTLNKDTLTILEFIYNQYNDIQVGDIIKHMPAVTGTNLFAMDWDIVVTDHLYCQLMDKSIEKMSLITEKDKRWEQIKRIYHYTDDKYKYGDDKSYVISKELLCKIMQVEDKLNKTKIQIWVKRNNLNYYGESDVDLKNIKNDIVAYVAKTITIRGLSEFDTLEEGDLIQYAIFNINKTPLGIGYNGYMEYDNTTNFNIYDACIVSSDHINRVYHATEKKYNIMKGITSFSKEHFTITKCKKVVAGKEVVYDDAPFMHENDNQYSNKRKDYISWNEYFMGTAILAGYRSKDPGTQVGACIVDSDNKIVSIGYNGFPKNCSDDNFPWAREAASEYDTKYMYVVHAELNAILNTGGRSLKDTTIFVTLFPCNECAKAIIQSGIKKIVYQNDKYADTPSTKASKRMLEAAGVELEHLPDTGKSITISI